MSIKGGEAVAVVDDDMVAVAVAPADAGCRDHAGLAGEDRRARYGGEIDAVVQTRHAGDRVYAVAVRRGHALIAVERHREKEPGLRYDRNVVILLLLAVQLLLARGDLLFERVHVVLNALLLLDQILSAGDQLGNGLIGFGALLLERLLRGSLLDLLFLEHGLLLREGFLRQKHLLSVFPDLSEHPLVTGGNLLDHGLAHQHILKAGGVKQHLPIADVAALL